METFQVDSQTASRIKRLATELECGLCDVIRQAVGALDDTLALQMEYEMDDRETIQEGDYRYYQPPREFAGSDEAPF